MRTKIGAAVVAIAFVAGVALLPSAARADDDTQEVRDALETVTNLSDTTTSASTNVLDDVVAPSKVQVSATGEISSSAGEGVTIPADSSEPLVIGDVAVTLPFAEVAADAEPIQTGVVAFDNANGSATAPVIKTDGSVQIVTTIESGSAPTEYSYQLDFPDDATVAQNDPGIILVTKGDALVLGIDAPWAFDAAGTAVPTHYELNGKTLTQVVDHTEGAYQYPIAADPWLGGALFGSVYQNSSIPKVWGTPTPWGTSIQTGVAVGNWGIGQAIMKTAGWDEWANKAPLSRTRPTYKQQFDCHVTGAYTPITGGPTWDLEGYRANRPNWLIDGGALPYKCNWP